MFDFLGDLARGAGRIVGTAVGSVIGLSSVVIATTLGITVEMVDEAREAGCETYEEIREFFDL
jgi:hypothetical protein